MNFMELLRGKAEGFAALYNLRVYDITFRKEQGGRVLRIYLDGAVTLDGCAAVSRLVSAWLDGQCEDFIPYDNYKLEVSSLGINRPLRSAEDFAAGKGRICRIQTKEKDSTGRKRYKGRITGVSEGSVTICSGEENAAFNIDIADIAKANIEAELGEATTF